MKNSVQLSPNRGRSSPLVIDVARDFNRYGFIGFWDRLWKQYGDFTYVRIGKKLMFLAVHPDVVRYVSIDNKQNYEKRESYKGVRELLLGDGLLTSNGERWKKQRKLMSPFFTPKSIEAYYPIILRDGMEMAERWEKMAGTGQPVDMPEEMMRVTASIILRSMFSTESDQDMVTLKDAIGTMIAFVAQFQGNPLSPPLWVPTPTNRKYRKSKEIVEAFIKRLIDRRRAMPEDQWPEDLLTKLMRARDEQTGQPLSDKTLRDECITIFFAGHETTATTLTFMWYSLAKHPSAARKVQEEIDSVVGTRQPTIDDMKRMPYILQVIKEVLRLYPAAPMYVRDAVGEDEIDGLKVPAGGAILLSPYLTHRHTAFWPDPERFDPDRWLPGCEEERHPNAWHPFAVGQRICLGNNFSLFESHLLAAILAARFVPRAVEGFTPRLDMMGTLRSMNGVSMLIEKRS